MSEETVGNGDLRTVVLVAATVAGIYGTIYVAKNLAYRSYLKVKKSRS